MNTYLPRIITQENKYFQRLEKADLKMDSVKKEDVVKSEVIETEKVDEEKTVIKSISGMLFIQIIICL